MVAFVVIKLFLLLQAIKNDVLKHSQEFENTCNYGEILISCCDVDTEIVRHEINELRRRWDRINHGL